MRIKSLKKNTQYVIIAMAFEQRILITGLDEGLECMRALTQHGTNKQAFLSAPIFSLVIILSDGLKTDSRHASAKWYAQRFWFDWHGRQLNIGILCVKYRQILIQ